MKSKITLFLLFISIFSNLPAAKACGPAYIRRSLTDTAAYNTEELTSFDYNTRGKAEAYPFLSNDGKELYFVNDRTKNWVFYTRKDEDGKWKIPVPIEIDNFSASILSCYLTDDKKNFFFLSEGNLYSCQPVDGSLSRFSGLSKVNISSSNNLMRVNPFSYLSFSADGQYMYAYMGNSTDHSMGSYIRTGENAYSFVEFISTTKKEMGFISKNGLVYYYTNDVKLNVLFCKKRNSTKEAFGPAEFIVKEFEQHLHVSQISFAEKSKLMAVVLTHETWENNEVFFLDIDPTDSNIIANKPIIVTKYPVITTATPFPMINPDALEQEPIIKPAAPLITKEINNQSGVALFKAEIGRAYPNPAKNVFYFFYSIADDKDSRKQATAVMIDNMGRQVYTQQLDTLKGEAKIEFEGLAAGTYFIRIDYNGTSSAVTKVVIMGN